MILSRDDHLSFSIYNRGFDQEEFVVQDRFTLNLWIKALQQHIVDMRKKKFFFLSRSVISKDLGAWEHTFEHIPSMRRYSYQPLTTSMSATNLTEKSTLRTKARSLDALHQVGITAQPIRLTPTKYLEHSTDTDDDDDLEESVLHTRL